MKPDNKPVLTSSETASTGPMVVPVPPFEDLHPKDNLVTVASTSPSHPSLLQTIKDKVFHHDAPIKPLESSTIVVPVSAVHNTPEHTALDTLVEKITHPHLMESITHPHPPAGSLIHPFERPLEMHTIAETHHLPEPRTHIQASSETASAPIPVEVVPVLIIEETIEVAIVPEPTIPGEEFVPSIDEHQHHHHHIATSSEGKSESSSIPTASSTTTGVKRKLHQD